MTISTLFLVKVLKDISYSIPYVRTVCNYVFFMYYATIPLSFHTLCNDRVYNIDTISDKPLYYRMYKHMERYPYRFIIVATMQKRGPPHR